MSSQTCHEHNSHCVEIRVHARCRLQQIAQGGFMGGYEKLAPASSAASYMEHFVDRCRLPDCPDDREGTVKTCCGEGLCPDKMRYGNARSRPRTLNLSPLTP